MKKGVIRYLIIFPMLGAIMFISKVIMEFLPNIHAIAMFIAVFTLVYRWRALIPIYLYVFLVGLYNGFGTWWVPYIYIWTILWAFIMLIPKRLSINKKAVISAILCGLHGITYGILYAPFQALAFGLSFEGMIAWIVAGFPFDIVHMCGNIAMSFLILPLYKAIVKLENQRFLK
jgi:energy-coupling factor transport system substrate-specific component